MLIDKYSLLFFLLPIAFICGWLAANRNQARSKRSFDLGAKDPKYQNTSKSLNNQITHDYFLGLNYLLNDKPGKAADLFIKIIDQNDPNSLQTTLTLGNFFRKNGEVDKAASIHQQLLAKQNIPSNLKEQISLELANDYMAAGVYDRAENLYLQLINSKFANSEFFNQASQNLLKIYEHEKDWQKAINIAFNLANYDYSWLFRIAHYYCELAHSSWQHGKIRLTFKYLKQGFSYDPDNIRILLMRADFYLQLENHKQAIKNYQAVIKLNINYLSLVLPKLKSCYQSLKDLTGFGRYLDHLELEDQQDFDLINSDNISFKCHQCGFEAKNIEWQCPGCKNWGTLKPSYLANCLV